MSARRPLILIRVLAAVLSAILFAEPVLADLSTASVWNERRSRTAPTVLASLPATNLPALSAAARLPLAALPSHAANALSVRVPATLGRITRVVDSNGQRPPVLFIQDVHGSVEAQRAIRAAIESMIGGAQHPVLALEGAAGPLDLGRYRRFPEPGVIGAAADYLFENLEISGPARAALTADVAVAGIDDAALHAENAAAYRRAAPIAETARQAIREETARLETEKGAAFSPNLRAFDATVAGFRSGTIPLSRYAAAVAPFGTDGGVTAFLEAAKLESTLDFARAESQRTALLEKLVSRATPAELERLTRDAAALRLGDLPPAAFYKAFDALCCDHGLPLTTAPAFAAYVRYVSLAESIDGARLWSAFARLEKAGYATLARTAEEKRLVARSRANGLAARLVEFSLTPEEWADWRDGARTEAPVELTAFEDFYRAAEKRDAAMAANINALADRPVILVAGGFHAGGLVSRIAAAGRPVTIWTPTLKTIDTGLTSKALGVFAREKTPIEELFSGQRLFLADHPFRGLPKIVPLAAALSADPQRAIESLVPGANARATVRSGDDGDEVLIERDGTTARSTVRHAGLRILGFRESDGRSLTNRAYEHFARKSAAAGAAVAAAAGFVQEFSARVVIAAAVAAGAWALSAGGLNGAVPLLFVAIIGFHAAYFATLDHPAGRFLGRVEALPLTARQRWMGAAFALGLGAIQMMLLNPFAPTALNVFGSAVVLSALHASISLIGAAAGAPFAMAKQRRVSEDRIDRIIAARDRRIKPLRLLRPETLLARAAAFREDAAIGEFTDERIGYAVALFSVAAEKAMAAPETAPEFAAYIGGSPSRRQIEAAVALLNRRGIAGMRPSEGKTLTVALACWFQVAMGRRPEVHDWNSTLAARDAQVSGLILGRLGVKVGVFTGTRIGRVVPEFHRRNAFPHLESPPAHGANQKREDIRQLYADSDVVYGPYSTMIYHWMDDWFGLFNGGLHPTALPDWIFVEELDTPFLDAAGDPLVLARRVYTYNRQREQMFKMVYRFADSLQRGRYFVVERDRVRFRSPPKLVELAGELQAKLEAANIKGLSVMLDEQGTRELLIAALEAIHLFQPKRDYFIINSRVVIRDTTTGEVKPDQRWSRGIHTFVEIKESQKSGIPVRDPAVADVAMTTRLFYNLVSRWSGVAGVLDARTQNDLREDYAARIFDFPPIFETQRDVRPPQYFRTEEQKVDAIVDQVTALYAGMRATGQPVRPILINAASPVEAEVITERLEARIDSRFHALIDKVDGQDEAHDAYVWGRMGLAGAITVAAQVASRGHEIKLEENLYAPSVTVDGFGKIDGLVVVNTHYSPLERLDVQVETRAGRRGRPGVYFLFENAEGNELLENHAPERLAEILAGGGQPDPAAFESAIAEARARWLETAHKRSDWLEKRYRLLILAHGQFAELAKGMIDAGQEPKRFFNLSSDILQRANVSIQLGDDDLLRKQVARLREEIKYMSGVLKTPGLNFALNLPLGDRLRLLRQTQDIKASELSEGSGIPLSVLSEAETGRNTPRIGTMRKLLDFYVEKGFDAASVRKILGQPDPATFLRANTGLSRPELLKKLRLARWMTMAEMGALLEPAMTLGTISDWEKGLTHPTETQLRQLLFHFIEHEGFPYEGLFHLFGIRSNDEILDSLQGEPLDRVFEGLRGGRTFAEVAAGVGGVTEVTARQWETDGTHPRDGVMRRILAYYTRQGYQRDRLRKLFGFPLPSEVEAQYEGKSRNELLELVRKAIPFDQKEWAELLGVSVSSVNEWNKTEQPAKPLKEVPLKAVRAAAKAIASYGFSEALFLKAAGAPTFDEGLAALAGKPMNEILLGIRALTGEDQKDIIAAIGTTRASYKAWETRAWPPRPFRVRLVAYWGVKWKMSQATLRTLLEVPNPPELMAKLGGKTLADLLPLLQTPYDYTDNSLAQKLGVASSSMHRYRQGGKANDETIEAMADHFSSAHRLPREELLAVLKAGNEAQPGVQKRAPQAAPNESAPTDIPPTGDSLGVWPVWKSLHDRALSIDSDKGTRWRFNATVSVIGFVEELIARPLLGTLPLLAPFFGLDPATTFVTALALYAIAFATVLHPGGYIGRSEVPIRLTVGQRLRLFALAAGLGVLQFALPLPAWALYPALGVVHAAFNLRGATRNDVLGMGMVPEEQLEIDQLIRSDSKDRPKLLAAIRYIGQHPGTADLELLDLVLENNAGDVELGLAVIEAMRTIRRTSVPFYRELQHEDLNGIVWHALRDAGLPRDNFTLIEDPDGRFKELRFTFPPGKTFSQIDDVLFRLRDLYTRKNPHLSPRLEPIFDPGVPAGQSGRIRIFLPITAASLTDHQRGFGMLDFSISRDGELLPLLSEELAAKVEEFAWTFLRGMSHFDQRRIDLVNALYGDGSEENPGILSALRQLDRLGEKEIVQVESTTRLDPMTSEPRNLTKISLNAMIKMANTLPYFTRFIPENGIDHIGYFARATGSHFAAAYLKGLLRGRIEDDFMIYVSRDTIGLAVYKPIWDLLATLYGMRAKDFRGTDGRVKNFTIYRLAALQWVRNQYYAEDQMRLPDGRLGWVVYRKSEAWHDESGRLHEKLSVFSQARGGRRIAEIHRVTKAFDFRTSENEGFDENKFVDANPTYEGADWIDADGGRRAFSGEEVRSVQPNVPAFQNRNRIAYAVRAIGAQLANAPFLQNLPPATEDHVPVVELVDEVGLGSAALLTTFAIEARTHRDEEEVTAPPSLLTYRVRFPENLSEADGERWMALEREYRAARRTDRSVEVELFIGQARDYDAAPKLPGFPDLKVAEIASLFGLTTEQADELRDYSTGGAAVIPQPYSMDWDNLPGQPALADIPIKLESPVVRTMAYLNRLFIYNSVVRYYRQSYVRRVAHPLIRMIGNPESPVELQERALEALPEFSFRGSIQEIVRLAKTRTDLNARLDAVARTMFARNLNHAITFDGGKITSVERFEALLDKRAMIEEFAADDNPLAGLRQVAREARRLLDEARAAVTVLGMELADYEALTDRQREELRRAGYYPFPLMTYATEGELQELDRVRAVYGIGPARLATHADMIELLQESKEPDVTPEPDAKESSRVRLPPMEITLFPLIEEALRLFMAIAFGALDGGVLLFPFIHAMLHMQSDVLKHGQAGAMARLPLRIGLSALFGAAFYVTPMLTGVNPTGVWPFLVALSVHLANNAVALFARDRLPGWLKPFSIAMSLNDRSESRENRAGRGIVSAMITARDGAADRDAIARSLTAALDGAERPVSVAENPFSTLASSLDRGALDRDRLAAAIRRAWAEAGELPLDERSARGALAGGLYASSASDDTALARDLGEGAVGTVWVMDASNAGRADAVIRQATAEGRKLLILVADPRLRPTAVKAAVGRNGVRIVDDIPGLLVGSGDARTLDLRSVESAAESAWGRAFVASARLRILTPAVEISLDGLSADSPLRAATFLILDALNAVPVSIGDLETVAELARLVGRQA